MTKFLQCPRFEHSPRTVLYIQHEYTRITKPFQYLEFALVL